MRFQWTLYEYINSSPSTVVPTCRVAAFNIRPSFDVPNGQTVFKVNGPFVQTCCIEKDSYMDAI